MSKRVSSATLEPLAAWGEALRMARARRLGRRRWLTLTAGAALVGGLIVAIPKPAPRLLWNATPSAPMGLYRVEPLTLVHVGDWIAVAVPKGYRTMAVARHYIAVGVPLVKRVAAGPGDEVCALGSHIFVVGEPVARRHDRDGAGRPLPLWNGCRILGRNEIFLLNAASPDSFDGRYFGSSPASDIIGIARPVWVR